MMNKVSLWPSSCTEEQKRAYDRYIRARNNVGLGQYRKYIKGEWRPASEVLATVDQSGENHPLFEQNDDWLEYRDASEAWWAIEPEFRKQERMSMIKGDYGSADSWREKKTQVKEM